MQKAIAMTLEAVYEQDFLEWSYGFRPKRGAKEVVQALDVWSRRILGWAVHEEQTSELAAELLCDVCAEHDIEADSVVLHQDNGSPMKGATFLATLDALGVTKSFSRPGVSDDNAFIESLFRP